MELSTISPEQLSLTANTIRILSAEGVEKANSGHPGMPMGMAEIGTVLWLKHLRFNPADPGWLDRDRFVLSNGHGSMFLYSLLHLSGYDVSIEDLKSFRQWESKTPGHPENYMTDGVEATTGPLGQGISNAVGMALGQKLLAERYNTAEQKIFDHRVFICLGDGCLMEGVSSEASSVAGHLGLGNMIALYDDNHISIAGSTELAFTEDVGKRYESYGWHVQHVDGHDFSAIDAAIDAACVETDRPSLICARTTIGKGSPNKADSHDVHGSPLGDDELAATKKELNWPETEQFSVPAAVKELFAARVEELTEEYQRWGATFASWKGSNAEKAQALEQQTTRSVPADLRDKLIAAVPGDDKPISTRKLSGMVLQAASKAVNSLVGGSADLEPSTLTLIKDSTGVQRGEFAGLNIRFGVREHGMGAIMNGLSYQGAFIPYGSTFLCFSDYMRPTIRLAALSHLPALFIFTHDSVFLGEDGPTHQPVEHVNSLRMIPNLYVMRPADGLETAMCYDMALRRQDGPCLLIFTRQNLQPVARPDSFDPESIACGAYVAYEAGNPDLVLVATGSEVSLAIESAKRLGDGVRVVSMPCWERFTEQPESFRNQLIPTAAKKVTIEAGSIFGWSSMLGCSEADVLCIGIDRFGASAPASVIAEKLGLTPDAVVKRIQSWS